MRRVLAIGAVSVVGLLLVAELLAVPIAQRLIGGALERCLPYEHVSITRVDRPVVPRLLIGRATGVEMEAEGLVLAGDLRVDEASLEVPLVILPWSLGDPDPEPATLELVLVDDDLERFLAVELPFGLRPAIELSPGVAQLGLDPFPVRVEVAVAVEDREVAIGPAGDPPEWWDRLPIPESFTLPEDLALSGLEVGDGEVTATLVVDELPGVDGARDCGGTLAAVATIGHHGDDRA